MISKPTPDNHYTWGERCEGWTLTLTEDLAVVEERMPPGTTEKAHHHKEARQFFRVMKGILSMELDEGVFPVKAGEGIEIAPGEVHRAFNDTKDVCVFLVISSPSTKGDRFDANF